MNIQPYLRIIKAYAKEDSVNPKRLIGGITISLFRVFLLIAIYKVAYKNGSASLSFENTIWSLAIYFAFIMNLNLRKLFSLVENGVKSGEVEAQLTKPLDWRLTKLCQLIGKNGTEFILQIIILPIFLLVMIGPPDISFWTPLFLAAFCVLSIFAVISASYLFLSIGLFAFWLNDAKSIYHIVDKIVTIFGGAFVPIALLPNIVQSIVRLSPFGVYAAPTQLFNPNVPTFIYSYLISAFIWSLVLVKLCNVIWGRAQRKIEVNGG